MSPNWPLRVGARRFLSTSPRSQFPRAPPRVSRPPVSIAHLIQPEEPAAKKNVEPKPARAAVPNPRHTAPLETLEKGFTVPTTKPTPNARNSAPIERPKKGSKTLLTKPERRPSILETLAKEPKKRQTHHEIPIEIPSTPAYQSSKSRTSSDPTSSDLLEESEARSPREQRPNKYDYTLPTYQSKYTLRWETTPPTSVQLDLATRFFTQHPPKFLWSAEKFKKIDFGDVPEVAFLGRSNVGKSSLLNALLNHHSMATTSSKPGRTRLMNAFSINQGKLVLLDMPGYGHAARAEWGVQIMKYLLSRKQFKRAFLLIDAHHGPKETDFQMLDHLGASGIPYQVVLSKIDKIHRKPQDLEAAFTKMKELLTDRDHRRGTSVLGEILATASSPAKKGEVKIGMADLRWAVMVAGGLEGTSYS